MIPPTRGEPAIRRFAVSALAILVPAISAAAQAPASGGSVRDGLLDHFRQTNICQGNSLAHSIEQYHLGWQGRSARLLGLAAEALKRD